MGNEANIKKVYCKQCTGEMHYDIKKAALICPFCGYEEAQILAGTDRKINDGMTGADLFRYHGVGGKEITEEELQEKAVDWGQTMLEATCKSCGGQIMFPEGSMTTTCPYCSSTVLDVSATKEKAPMGVALFQVERDQIRKSLGLPIFDNLLCPKDFKKAINIDDFTAMYVPIWNFDIEVNITYKGRYGFNNNHIENSVDGTYNRTYKNLNTPASHVYESLVEDQMKHYSVEIHVPYKPELVSGYIVQKYTILMKDAYEKLKKQVKERAVNDIKSKLSRKHEALFVELDEVNIEYVGNTYRYLLMPIYFHSIPYDGKVYPESVNGQNGTYVGDFPAKFRKSNPIFKMYV